MNDKGTVEEEDNESSGEKKYWGMTFIEACGFCGWVFIIVGIYVTFSMRFFYYQTWDEYFNDDNIISRISRYFFSGGIFVGLMGVMMKRYGHKKVIDVSSEEE